MGFLLRRYWMHRGRRAGEIVNRTRNNNETQASSAGLGFSCVSYCLASVPRRISNYDRCLKYFIVMYVPDILVFGRQEARGSEVQGYSWLCYKFRLAWATWDSIWEKRTFINQWGSSVICDCSVYQASLVQSAKVILSHNLRGFSLWPVAWGKCCVSWWDPLLHGWEAKLNRKKKDQVPQIFPRHGFWLEDLSPSPSFYKDCETQENREHFYRGPQEARVCESWEFRASSSQKYLACQQIDLRWLFWAHDGGKRITPNLPP